MNSWAIVLCGVTVTFDLWLPKHNQFILEFKQKCVPRNPHWGIPVMSHSQKWDRWTDGPPTWKHKSAPPWCEGTGDPVVFCSLINWDIEVWSHYIFCSTKFNLKWARNQTQKMQQYLSLQVKVSHSRRIHIFMWRPHHELYNQAIHIPIDIHIKYVKFLLKYVSVVVYT